MNLQLHEHDDRSESGNLVKSIIVGAILGGVFHVLFNRPEHGILHDLPPIVFGNDSNDAESIKIETHAPFDESSFLPEGSWEDPTILAQKRYTIPFRTIPHVRLFRDNEMTGGSYPTQLFTRQPGNKVGIWLQFEASPGNWRWEGTPGGGSPSADPQILISGETSVFTMYCEQLHSKNMPHSHTRRKFKHVFKINRRWRFGKIKVYNFVGGEFLANDGDVFKLEFWEHFH